MLAQKLLIWLLILTSGATFIVAALLIIGSFGFWSGIAVPLIGIFWTILAGLTYDHSGMKGMSAILALSAVAFFYVTPDYSEPGFFFVLSIWLYRTSYISAQAFLTNLIEGSYAAFDMLVEHIEIQEVDSAD